MIGVWYDGESRKITMVLKSFKCSWNKCVFCCFSDEAAKDYDDLMETNLRILNKSKEIIKSKEVREIAIFNGGSFFELPYDLMLKISELTLGKTVNIETRPEFLSQESLAKTLTVLKPKELIVRVGLESSSEEIRDKLNKGIPDTAVKRIIKLRSTLNEKIDSRIKFVAYVLFGLDGIDEESVMRSVEFFNSSLDGVIAIKYRRYKQNMPSESIPSTSLMVFLKQNCLDIDLTNGEIWEITG